MDIEVILKSLRFGLINQGETIDMGESLLHVIE